MAGVRGWRSSATAACGLVMACAAPAPPASPLSAPASPASGTVAPAPTAAPAPPVPEWPAALEEPGTLACTIRAASWPSELRENPQKGTTFLRFRSGGSPFAVVYRGTNAELAIPVADPLTGGMVSLDANGVLIRGVLDAGEMPLYPAGAFVLSGVFVPDHERRIGLRSARSGGRVTVAAEAVPKLRIDDGDLTADRTCADLSLGPVVLEHAAVEAAIGQGAKFPDPPPWPGQWLKPGDVPLATTAGGPPVAKIQSTEPPDDTILLHQVVVLGTERDKTRIAVSTFGGTVFGWVPTARLHPSKRVFMDLQHDCFYVIGRMPREGGTFVACDHELVLVARAGRERRRVGTVRAGTAFERRSAEDEWTEITFRDAGVEAAPGGAFLVREADAKDCPAAP